MCLMDNYAKCTALFIVRWCHLQLRNNNNNNTVVSTQTWVQFFTPENLPDEYLTTPGYEYIWLCLEELCNITPETDRD